MGTVITIGILIVFLGALFLLYTMASKFVKFPRRVFVGLLLGVFFGFLLQFFFSESHSSSLTKSLQWIDLIGSGYVLSLKMITMPLIMVSIASAILSMNSDENLGKTTWQILGVLVITTIFSATIGVLVTQYFHLEAPLFATSTMTDSRGAVLENLATTTNLSLTNQILQVLPVNPFLDMTGARPTSTIAVVIFMAFFALATRQIAKKKEHSFNQIKVIVDSFHDVVMRMLTMVLRLTPYGVLALVIKMVAISSWEDIRSLFFFIIVSYIGLILIFLTHLILLAMNGLNPITYVKKSWTVFLFGFTSRTSAGAVPLSIKTQVQTLGVSKSSANLSSSLGVSIGQNGCAGLYPAMVAVMIMTTSGMEINLLIIMKLIIVVAISSFGVAGVGGGATFSALIVLGIMNLPVALVGLLISIEPLIDMGRTMINISGSMVAGVLSSNWQKTLDTEKYNDPLAVISDDAL